MDHVKIWAPCVKICWVFLIIIHEFCWDCINFSFSWFFKVRKYILVYLYVDFYFYVLGFTILFINLIYSVYISNNMTTIRMDDYAKKNSIFKYINMLYNVCLEILLYIIVFFINLPRLRVVECWRKTKKKKNTIPSGWVRCTKTKVGEKSNIFMSKNFHMQERCIINKIDIERFTAI